MADRIKAIQVADSLPRYGLAKVAGSISPGLGAKVGPLSLVDTDELDLPGPGWHRVRPRLSGICGSDLATVDGKSSPYFQPLVSFPFVLGHEIVGDLDGANGESGGRVVIEPVLGCAARGVDPPCRECAIGRTDNCERTAFGHLKPGLQTGYCADTGGGWSTSMVAHESQIHRVPDQLDDDAAVMVEPAACAIHGVLGVEGATVLVLGAGTLGLCAIAALRRFGDADTIIAAAKHPEQRRWARELGADVVVEPRETHRLVRRATRSLRVGASLSGGVDVVIDCVGSARSIEEDLAVVRPGGDVVLLGMPSTVTVDLTPLWHRQIRVRGSYAYGTESVDGQSRRTFDLAFELVEQARLGRLVSARYPLDRYREAIDHAANAGSRGAVKVAFDLRGEKRR
jgi:threonine dehydrogenase-like Zn-dependent dehydrogenase